MSLKITPTPNITQIPQELVKQTVEQINKDLYSLGHEITQEVQVNPYDAITTALSDILQKLPIAKVQRFLYQVDVPEKAFSSILKQSKSLEEKYQALAHLILEREFKKVYLRWWFSRQEK